MNRPSAQWPPSWSKRPQGLATARLARCACVALTLAGSSCARDLTLPEPPQVHPDIFGLSPPTGFAGETLEVFGRNFDPFASGNELIFPLSAAIARGISFSPNGALRVRVPDDALSGPVVARTREGSSAPFEGFTYRGLGRPHRGVLTSRIPVALNIVGLAAGAGRVFVASSTLEMVVSQLGESVFSGSAPRDAILAPDGSLLVADAVGLSRIDLSRRAPGTPAYARRTTPFPVGFAPHTLLPVVRGGRPLVEVVGRLGSGPKSARPVAFLALDLETMEFLGAPLATHSYGIGQAAASADGRLVAVATSTCAQGELPEGGCANGRTTDGVRVVCRDGCASADVWLASPLGTRSAGVAVAGGRVVASFDDGNLRAFAPAAPAASWSEPWRSGTRAPLEHVYAAPLGGGHILLVTVPSEARLVAFDLDGRLLWSVPTGPEPSYVAIDESTHRAYVADATHALKAVDYAAGRALFPMGITVDPDPLGMRHPPRTLAWYAPPGRAPAVAVISSIAPYTLLELSPDAATWAAWTLPPAAGPPRALATSYDERSLFVLCRDGLVQLAPAEDDPSTLSATLVGTGLPADSRQLLMTRDGRAIIVVGHECTESCAGDNAASVVVWQAGANARTYQLPPKSWVDLAVLREDGRLLLVWSAQPAGKDNWEPHAELWDVDALASGGTPDAQTPALPEADELGAVFTGGRAFMFFDGEARALGPDLALGPARPAPVSATDFPVLVAPPNAGGALVWRSSDDQIHLTRLNDDDSFSDLATAAIPGVDSLIFDPAGERAFLALPSLDSVGVLE